MMRDSLASGVAARQRPERTDHGVPWAPGDPFEDAVLVGDHDAAPVRDVAGGDVLMRQPPAHEQVRAAGLDAAVGRDPANEADAAAGQGQVEPPAPRRVPNVMGLSLREAVGRLHHAGLRARTSGFGRIVRTAPSVGATVAAGTLVTVYAESGERP